MLPSLDEGLDNTEKSFLLFHTDAFFSLAELVQSLMEPSSMKVEVMAK